MLFADYLRGQELFRRLAGTYDTVEGNLLERADATTTEAQLEALRYALHRASPRRVLETGTNKSLFGYVLAHLIRDVDLYTFDGDPRCAAGVALLNAGQANVRAHFTLGDTKQTLPAFDAAGVDFAWIDGGHDEATAHSDIRQAMRLGVPLMAVDDVRIMPEVARAIAAALRAQPAYQVLDNPYYPHDGRGIVLLHRVP
jgi:predicted O-methyltransferase YrrM